MLHTHIIIQEKKHKIGKISITDGRTNKRMDHPGRRERERDLIARDKIVVMNGRKIEHETKQR